jgi:hypothetical protein
VVHSNQASGRDAAVVEDADALLRVLRVHQHFAGGSKDHMSHTCVYCAVRYGCPPAELAYWTVVHAIADSAKADLKDSRLLCCTSLFTMVAKLW